MRLLTSPDQLFYAAFGCLSHLMPGDVGLYSWLAQDSCVNNQRFSTLSAHHLAKEVYLRPFGIQCAENGHIFNHAP